MCTCVYVCIYVYIYMPIYTDMCTHICHFVIVTLFISELQVQSSNLNVSVFKMSVCIYICIYSLILKTLTFNIFAINCFEQSF